MQVAPYSNYTPMQSTSFKGIQNNLLLEKTEKEGLKMMRESCPELNELTKVDGQPAFDLVIESLEDFQTEMKNIGYRILVKPITNMNLNTRAKRLFEKCSKGIKTFDYGVRQVIFYPGEENASGKQLEGLVKAAIESSSKGKQEVFSNWSGKLLEKSSTKTTNNGVTPISTETVAKSVVDSVFHPSAEADEKATAALTKYLYPGVDPKTVDEYRKLNSEIARVNSENTENTEEFKDMLSKVKEMNNGKLELKIRKK